MLEITVPHPEIESGLRVTTADDEVSIGFREWHADLLVAGPEEDRIAAAAEFVRLVVSYREGRFDDAWVIDDEEGELRYARPGERLAFGTWQQLAGQKGT